MSHRARLFIAVLCIALLSAPSALGVQRALAVTRGDFASWLAAIGIELAYVTTIILSSATRVQHEARRVALFAVSAAIILNIVADYAARQPESLTSSAAFVQTFDVLLIVLSIVESAPLAGLAYVVALLTHKYVDAQRETHNETDTVETVTAKELAAARNISLRQAYRLLAKASNNHVKQNSTDVIQ